MGPGLHGHPAPTQTAAPWAPASVVPGPVTAQPLGVVAGSARAPAWRSPTVPGMAAGHPGHRGHLAAPHAGSVSRCDNEPAATPARDTVAACAWARTVRKDTAMSICCVPHTCSGQAGGPGSGARPSVVAAFKLAAELARMGLTVQVAMWSTSLVTLTHVQS